MSHQLFNLTNILNRGEGLIDKEDIGYTGRKRADIFVRVFSTEDRKGSRKVFEVAGEYKDLNPDWYTVTYKAGVDFTTKQCNGLLDRGEPGLHFYAFNKLDPVREVLGKIRR